MRLLYQLLFLLFVFAFGLSLPAGAQAPDTQSAFAEARRALAEARQTLEETRRALYSQPTPSTVRLVDQLVAEKHNGRDHNHGSGHADHADYGHENGDEHDHNHDHHGHNGNHGDHAPPNFAHRQEGQDEESYVLPAGYKLACELNFIRLRRVKHIKNHVKNCLGGHEMQEKDERIEYNNKALRTVEDLKTQTRHFFVMNELGDIRYLTKNGEHPKVAKVRGKGLLIKTGNFALQQVVKPVVMGTGMSLVSAPIYRTWGIGVFAAGGGTIGGGTVTAGGAPAGCHYDLIGGRQILHCGPH